MPWFGRSVLAAALVGMLGANAFAQGRPAAVSVAIVEMREISETVPVFGEVVAARQSEVAARVSGVVDEVLVQTGDTVMAGDILVRLDTELLEIERQEMAAQIAIADAGVTIAKERVVRAERDFDRATRLQKNSTIAESQVQDRQSDLATESGSLTEAQARLLVARANLDRAEYRIKNSEIVAPFDGTVLSVGAVKGQFISQGSEVAGLLDDDNLEIEANVPSSFVPAIYSDSIVEGRTDSGAELSLRVRAILPTESSATRTRPVRLVAVGVGPDAVGQSVTIDLPVSAPRTVLTVPKDALVQARGGWSVFVNQDGKAVPRPVEVGDALGDRLEVLSGLAPGDEVVIRGNERLRPMQDIMPDRSDARPTGAESAAKTRQVAAN